MSTRTTKLSEFFDFPTPAVTENLFYVVSAHLQGVNCRVTSLVFESDSYDEFELEVIWNPPQRNQHPRKLSAGLEGLNLPNGWALTRLAAITATYLESRPGSRPFSHRLRFRLTFARYCAPAHQERPADFSAGASAAVNRARGPVNRPTVTFADVEVQHASRRRSKSRGRRAQGPNGVAPDVVKVHPSPERPKPLALPPTPENACAVEAVEVGHATPPRQIPPLLPIPAGKTVVHRGLGDFSDAESGDEVPVTARAVASEVLPVQLISAECDGTPEPAPVLAVVPACVDFEGVAPPTTVDCGQEALPVAINATTDEAITVGSPSYVCAAPDGAAAASQSNSKKPGPQRKLAGVTGPPRPQALSRPKFTNAVALFECGAGFH